MIEVTNVTRRVLMVPAVLMFSLAMAFALTCGQAQAATSAMLTVQVPFTSQVELTDASDLDKVAAETFTYKIEAVTPGAPMPASDTLTISGSDLKDGEATAEFLIEYDQADIGTWEYRLTQVKGDSDGWKYSDAAYKVEAQIFWYDNSYQELESTVIFRGLDPDEKTLPVFVNVPPEKAQPQPGKELVKTGDSSAMALTAAAALGMVALLALAVLAIRRKQSGR